MKLKFLFVVGLLSFGIVKGQEIAKGVVFLDHNKNGIKDSSESGLKHVSVSNGRDVVQTNEKGEYTISVADGDIIFVIKPSGYAFPLNESNLSTFYYIHKPTGSPKLKYEATAPTGELPTQINFPLYPQEEHAKFNVLVFGDPQTYTLADLDHFNKGIIDEVKHTTDRFVFGISLGDLVGDNLTFHPLYKESIKKLNLPWYNVLGNHDLNFDVHTDSLSDETFENNFGPSNYSFNYADAHFIILDNVLYPNPRTGKGYLGGFREDQLEFIANDLKQVPKDKLIVLCFHIPLQHDNSDYFRNEDRQRLFDLLAPFENTVSMSAHTHTQQQLLYTKNDGWKQDKPHHEYNVGTTSGDWYSGVYNENGQPNSTMRDGTPKGYAFLNINGNNYSFDYKVAGEQDDYQIRITAPKAVLAEYLGQYFIYANFFMGKSDDVVQYRFDNGDWQNMDFIAVPDPSFEYEVLKFDNADTLLNARRPSNPIDSSHLWRVRMPKKLEPGKHKLQVKATNMFGKSFLQETVVEVVE